MDAQLPDGSNVRRFPVFSPGRFLPHLVLVTGLLAAGCATTTPPPAVEPPTVASTVAALPDTILATPLPPEPTLPAGPDGTIPLADMEAFFAEALALAGRGHTGLAEDHLFILQDAVEAPGAATADSLYQSHLLSLARRTRLLAGIIAEQTAAAVSTMRQDSLLAAGYGRLSRFAYPDSLVPATGITLPAITADLLQVDNQAVRRWENRFCGNGRRSFQVWLDRKAAVDSLIGSILETEGLPRELIYLGLVESGFNNRAVSSAAAVGPWQFMVGTGRLYGLRTNWWVDERRDPEMATRAAAAYLRDLHDQFGDWALALAAYNTGPGRVARRIRQHGHDNFWSLRLPAETTAHIPKFIAAARIGADPEAFGFTVADAQPLAYDTVRVDDATDLDLIARCADVPVGDVLALNPALLRGASPPDQGPYPVRVPVGRGDRTRKALARVPSDKRLTWRRHQVRRGETLGHIARRWGTSVGDIATLNRLGDVHRIHPGDQLLIPMPADLAAKARRQADEKGHYVPPNGYKRVSYKVRNGDTLGRIARSLGVTVTHLRKVNNIHGTSLIHPGQRIYAYRPGG